jgi:hypothetical protein
MSSYSSKSPSSFLQAVVDQDRLWVRVNVLVTLFNELRVADVYTDSGRAAALENLNSMTAANPYSIVDGSTEHLVNVRFSSPSNTGAPVPSALYAALFRDGWQEIFDALTSALNTPISVDPPPTAVDRFYSAVALAGAAIRNSIGIYNYQTFEQEYSLQWGP